MVLGERDPERMNAASPKLASRMEDPRVERTCRFAATGFPDESESGTAMNPQDLKVVKEAKPDRLEGRVCAPATILKHQRQGQRFSPAFFVPI